MLSPNLESSVIIVGSIVAAIIIISIIVTNIIKIKNFICGRVKKNQLSFLRQYEYHGSYSSGEKIVREKISKIIIYFKKMVINNSGGVSIESKFNKNNYAVFDLDTEETLILFKSLYKSIPYVLFISSLDKNRDDVHYWGIVDEPRKKVKDIFYDPNWKICNDQKYVSFCRSYNKIMIRGLYENENKKPKLFTINDKLSENFQLFIDKICMYYNKEGLELSVLRYKDPTLLMKFNRKIKLKQLNNVK